MVYDHITIIRNESLIGFSTPYVFLIVASTKRFSMFEINNNKYQPNRKITTKTNTSDVKR